MVNSASLRSVWFNILKLFSIVRIFVLSINYVGVGGSCLSEDKSHIDAVNNSREENLSFLANVLV